MWDTTGRTPVQRISNINKGQTWQSKPFVNTWPEPTDVHSDTGKSKKKTKRHRTAFSTFQLGFLEKMYNRVMYIDAKLRAKTSSFLKISEKSIKVWFQNRRMKAKRESLNTPSQKAKVPGLGYANEHGQSLPTAPRTPYQRYQNSFHMQNDNNSNHELAQRSEITPHSENRSSSYSFETDFSQYYEDYKMNVLSELSQRRPGNTPLSENGVPAYGSESEFSEYCSDNNLNEQCQQRPENNRSSVYSTESEYYEFCEYNNINGFKEFSQQKRENTSLSVCENGDLVYGCGTDPSEFCDDNKMTVFNDLAQQKPETTPMNENDISVHGFKSDFPELNEDNKVNMLNEIQQSSANETLSEISASTYSGVRKMSENSDNQLKSFILHDYSYGDLIYNEPERIARPVYCSTLPQNQNRLLEIGKIYTSNEPLFRESPQGSQHFCDYNTYYQNLYNYPMDQQ